ncbi:hypothetical protein BJ999_007065 [Actinomadura citrea]|jgi:hypothetical protein|uniref:Uncharacterized protein n=1 Tax=Actinomadura citrea TaxID=46158 RepID=A0A7Y9GI07_9ACTN|nr:hypothetical protein [Actinomadura citrea]
MFSQEFMKVVIEDRVRMLRAEGKNSRRARIAKALKR